MYQKQFLVEIHHSMLIAALADSLESKFARPDADVDELLVSTAVTFLERVLAVEDDPERCALVYRMRDRIREQQSLGDGCGAYDDLLREAAN